MIGRSRRGAVWLIRSPNRCILLAKTCQNWGICGAFLGHFGTFNLHSKIACRSCIYQVWWGLLLKVGQGFSRPVQSTTLPPLLYLIGLHQAIREVPLAFKEKGRAKGRTGSSFSLFAPARWDGVLRKDRIEHPRFTSIAKTYAYPTHCFGHGRNPPLPDAIYYCGRGDT